MVNTTRICGISVLDSISTVFMNVSTRVIERNHGLMTILSWRRLRSQLPPLNIQMFLFFKYDMQTRIPGVSQPSPLWLPWASLDGASPTHSWRFFDILETIIFWQLVSNTSHLVTQSALFCSLLYQEHPGIPVPGIPYRSCPQRYNVFYSFTTLCVTHCVRHGYYYYYYQLAGSGPSYVSIAASLQTGTNH